MKQRIIVKANIFKALGHPTRLWMVEQLAQGEKCVCEFVEGVDVDFSTISKHLSVLRHAGIVDMEKRGKQIFYRLTICSNNRRLKGLQIAARYKSSTTK